MPKNTRYFAGVRPQDLRITFTRMGKQRRFYARWRPQYRAWECVFRGHGIHTEPCFIESQFVAESILRLKESIRPQDGWKWLNFFKHRQWDGIPDPASPPNYYNTPLPEELHAQQQRTQLPYQEWARAA